MGWLTTRKKHKHEEELKEVAKQDATTFHLQLNWDILGSLTEQDIGVMTSQALGTHPYTDEEKDVYTPVFQAEVRRLELFY